ncbi:MAG: DNA mismatch repair endonuclease MutL [Phycisphaerales bacterium]|nr:DNA mismatch repair endonuclease MutL [Phycisphaerales bacterium]
MPIRTLPTALIHQIAAGEVVERPASVAKELIENALDAGASRIVVRIEGGGRERLEVIDDGAGIPPLELPLALAAHATSKIASSADLNAINTLGFRGEALCAIASVSHVTITSAQRGAREAWCIESRFGEITPARPASGGVGTTIEMRGLFANVPARRKFLRSDPAEAARVTEVVCNAALAHPHVSFRLESGGRLVLDFAAAADVFGRMDEVFGVVIGSDPLVVASEAITEEGHHARVTGVICRPAHMRMASRTQRLFVNSRPIVDRSLIHAVREAYRGLAPPALQPVFAIFLDVDPAMVDVNVHPQKSEVRWRSPAAMHRLVYRAVQDALRSANLATDGSELLSSPTHESNESREPRNGTKPIATLDVAMLRDHSAQDHSIPTTHARLLRSSVASDALVDSPAPAREFLQVDDTWIIFAEAGSVVIVDQHALHERIMFEEIRVRITQGDLMSQRMLVPATTDVAPESLARLEILAPLFARLGIEATAAGPRSIAVHAFPGFLTARGVDAASFVARALADDALASRCESTNDGSLREAALADVLDMMACKAAIKGGDRLSHAEISRLLDARESTDRATNCPHGRPTSVRIALQEIEKKFGRR